MDRTYSFLDVTAAIDGPGGNFPLGGEEGGVADEGITITATGDKNVMTPGADGSWMHSLKADKSATVTVTLLKTSPVNALLMNLYTYQTTSSRNHGQNVITIRDIARGDHITCQGVAFAKVPDMAYATEGGTVQWSFHAGAVSFNLGE